MGARIILVQSQTRFIRLIREIVPHLEAHCSRTAELPSIVSKPAVCLSLFPTTVTEKMDTNGCHKQCVPSLDALDAYIESCIQDDQGENALGSLCLLP